MLNIEAETKLKPEEAKARLEAFFGPGGEGLKLEPGDEDCLSFCSDLGYVNATISQKDSATVVSLTTQEYEYQVKKFLKSLP